MTLREIIGINIRKIRRSKRLTQEQLAELAFMQNTYIGGIERGERNISLNTIERIKDALNVTMADLIVTPTPDAWERRDTKIRITHILDSCSDEELEIIFDIIASSFRLAEIKNASSEVQ